MPYLRIAHVTIIEGIDGNENEALERRRLACLFFGSGGLKFAVN
jgi:hypothetical protein